MSSQPKMFSISIDTVTGEVTSREVTDPIGDPAQMMQQIMDDCPACQSARARGEVPQHLSLPAPRPPRPPRPAQTEPRPANWWHGKRPKRSR